ncbi:MAG TPA: SDR family oxidoreductase [Dokdonella sp.]
MNLLTRDRFALSRVAPEARTTALVIDLRHGGGAIAQSLARQGFIVVLGHAPCDADAAARVVAGIAAMGGHALAVEAAGLGDIDVMHLLDRAEDVFGRVDVLVDNGRADIPSRSAEDDLFDRYFGVALRGMVEVVREAAPRLRSGGSIVRLSAAGSGETPPPQAWMTPQAALEWLTRTFAAELARYDVRINAIAPSAGCDESAMAEAVALLLGADGSGCNGQVFDVGAAALRAIGASA